MIIPSRFRGPPASANGGYACGVVASLLPGSDVEVTLRVPPPLDRALIGEVRDGRAVLLDGDTVVAEATRVALGLEVPAPVAFADAERASACFPWRTTHPLPTCFVCGTNREVGDGLRLFPGAVPGREIAAAPWVPDASVVDEDGRVRREIVWAALDCPSWFGLASVRPWTGGLVLLGRLAARIDRQPRIGERCITVGWFLSREGRKVTCGSAIYGEHGVLHAYARAVWVELKAP